MQTILAGEFQHSQATSRKSSRSSIPSRLDAARAKFYIKYIHTYFNESKYQLKVSFHDSGGHQFLMN